MEYIYATMLLHSAKQAVEEANVQKVLEAAGVKADHAKVKALVASLKEVNIDEAIKQASVVQVAAPQADSTKKSEEEGKKKAEEEAKSEEAAAEGLGALFG